MKIPLPCTILRTVTNKPLPEINPDEIEQIIEVNINNLNNKLQATSIKIKI